MTSTSMACAVSLAAAVLGTTFGSTALAEDIHSPPLTDRQALGLVRAVYLEVQDRVSGGCWTSVSSIRQSVESSLRQTGITVYDEPLVYDAPFSIRLAVAAFGGRTGSGGSCGVTLTVTAFSPAIVGSLQGRGPQMALDAVLFDRKGMLLGTRLGERIAQQFETWLTEFGGDVLAGRRDSRVRAIADSRAGSPQALTVREWERQRR